MKYQINRIVDAIQFTGPESVPDIQAFMFPSSPLFNASDASNGKSVRLIIDVPNPEEDARWPGQRPHYKLAFLVPGDWIVKEPNGTFDHVTERRFADGAVPIVEEVIALAMPAAAPIEHLDVAAEIAASNAQDVIDPDPTGPIDATAAQASPAADALRAGDDDVF